MILRINATLIIFTVLLVFVPQLSAFDALPYVYVDFAHFFRLAQCEAKCTEKYGETATKNLLDGTSRQFFNTSNDNYFLCERGCAHGRLLTKKYPRSSVETAYKDGQNFWLQSQVDNGTNGESPIKSVDILCFDSNHDNSNGFYDSLAVKFAANLDVDFIAPNRFVVQWKQLMLNENGGRIESKWITAGSIEKQPVVKAEQLQPGVFYQFQMTIVGPNGRMGKSVSSDWFQAPNLMEPEFISNFDLKVQSKYNGEDGLSALLHWPKNDPIKISTNSSIWTSPESGMILLPPPTFCQFYLIFEETVEENKKLVDMIVEKDESEGFLFTNLEYSTEYLVKMKSMPSETLLVGNVNDFDAETSYKSLGCLEIHGKGSLECDPEPVENLQVFVDEKNATVFVSWQQAVDLTNVLLYQLMFSTVENELNDNDCDVIQKSQYLNSTSTNVTIILPKYKTCQFEIQIISFDLLGREAVAKTSFIFSPEKVAAFGNVPMYWAILGPVSALIGLCLIVHCAKCCCQRKNTKKVGELTERKLPIENV